MSGSTAGPIRVNVSVHGHVTEFFPDKGERFSLELPGPVSIREILGRLGVKPELIATALVNGTRQRTDFVPGDGDEIMFISPVAGG